jgi:UDP-4-amino-4,6-dideoxy-N-acetyl-beta-L-altrosamine transaminase/dTDP-4-dehydrorhamnose reductase
MNSLRRKLLITGVSGLLGNNLAYYFKDKYEVLGLYNSYPVNIGGIYTERCDISNEGSIKKIINEFRPSVIIHCASLTNIDQCEADKNLTKKINVLSTRNIAENIIDKDIKLLYISTDAVYDGVKGDFSERDKVSPLNYYGRSKYEGELEVARAANHLIFRTNIFGWNIQDKKSLGEWMLEELKANRKINCFDNVYFSSIYTFEFARVIDMALREDLTGVYNCGASDTCSKYEFALKIADCFGMDKKLIKPISINEFNFKAQRGKQLTLNVDKLQKRLNYKLPGISQSVETFYKDYRSRLPEEIKQGQPAIRGKSAFIHYGRQYIDESDIQAVACILRSERVTQGPKVEEFEKTLSEYCGAEYAAAVNSGTSALHIACLAADLKEGDEVITSPITFVASANCAVYCRAKPVFADIDPKTYNMAPEEIGRKITGRTKAVVAVHFAGQSCDMESIHRIVKEKEKEFGSKIFIIEDACHALGSSYKNRRIGSCAFSDMTVMSFHPVKHITTGEGGIVLTNNELLYKKLKRFRSHGITSNPEEFQASDLRPQTSDLMPWYYEQLDLGYNYRITDIQCALGLSQFKKLEGFRRRRREIIMAYNKAFSGVESIQIPFESADCDSNFHLYVLLFDFDRIGIERHQFMAKLKDRGIQTQVHYIPVHTQPFYRKNFNTNWGDCPNAEKYYERCLSIPLYPAMTDDDVQRVIMGIMDIVKP